MNLRFFYLLFYILCATNLSAQQEAAIWYFGENAGLDFRNGVPVPLTDGALDTNEGCSTISDPSGNLLFYTDGITVWNRNHIPMPNGNGLMGNPSSTQSGLIVPTPGNPDQFYVFTSSAVEWGNHDVRYSIVDLTLDGGMGDVVQKNTFLFDPSAEKLTAVEHANGTDIWLLTRRGIGNRFYAYRITPAGLTAPVISNLGVMLNDGPDSLGYFKVSPDGTKAALVYSDLEVELMDFNTATGQFSNVREIGDGDLFGYYGVEFSPSGRFVYVTNLDGDLFQYDTLAADVKGSRIQLPSNTTLSGALQLAIDGKIYIADANEPTLSVIEDPDVLGIGCNVNYNAISLAGRNSKYGLPPFIQSYFLVSFTAQHFCLGDVTQFNINASDPIVSILWDFGDGNTSIVENATHTYVAPGNYTVNVTVTTASETRMETKEITISEVPVANAVTNIEVCQTATTYDLDLSSIDAQVLGAQAAAGFSIRYFDSQTDADANTNVLVQPTTFNDGAKTVYARIFNTQNSLCYDTTSFDVVVKTAPELDMVADWTVCDDDGDGLYTFDLSTKDTEVMNGEDSSVFDLAYYPTQADADAATNALPSNYTNTLASETIFYRVQNSTYPDCFETGSFVAEVVGQVIANPPTNLEACDDNNDGISTLDLTAQEAQIIGTQSASAIAVSFHVSQTNADSNTNPLNAASYTNAAPYQETIYVRVSNASDTSCYDTTTFDVLIYDTPVVPQISDWLICDDNNDGLYHFDFTTKDVEILGNLNPTEYTITYHENQTDADARTNSIMASYQNTSNPQTIHFRIENNNSTSCSDTGSFNVQVFDEPTASQPTDVIICDTSETGLYQFDFSKKDTEVLNGQDAAIYEVSYHSSELDAINNGNALSSTDYSNTQMNEVIYTRVQHRQLTDCYAINQFSLLVNSLPSPNLEEVYVICPDSPDLQIDGGIFESWEWRNAEGNILGNQQTQNIVELGTYSLSISQTTNGIVCEKTTSFEVVSSGAPDSFTVSTSGLSDRITLTIEALGIGDFEYSIDGDNYQTDNQFEVFPGSYTVYVRDPFECRTLTQDIIAMGYEKFFTPNGDGIHENWNIIGTEFFPESRLYIYDRYGKLLQQVSTQGPGWDGSYLGRPLPSSDYWFKFEYGEGEVFTGHFALKR